MTRQVEPLTLNVSRAAQLLGISEKSCYRAVKEGKIPSMQFGRRILVPRYGLEKLLGKPEPTPDHGPELPRVPGFLQH